MHSHARASQSYDRALHDVGIGVFASLQSNCLWAWSDAGLIAGGDSTLSIDATAMFGDTANIKRRAISS
jgi:hypothetical protein